MLFSAESSNSQMILYGRNMLHFNKLYDFEEKFEKISQMKYDDTFAVIAQTFDEKKKAIALVGNTRKKLSL